MKDFLGKNTRGTQGALVAIAIALVVTLMLPRLSTPHEVIFDEHYFVDTIRALREHGEYRYLEQYTTHPPHGSIAAALSVSVFGDSPEGWRAMPLIAHCALMLSVMALGVLIFESFSVGLLAAVLLSLDGIAFGQATTLFFNAPMELFLVVSLILVVLATRATSRRSRIIAVCASGLAQGVATGFRWPALFLTLATAPLVFSLCRQERGLSRALVPLLGFLTSIFVGYLSPMLLLGVWGAWDSFSLFDFHRDTFLAVYNLKCEHRYNSPWWSWPLLLRPVWYYFAPPNIAQEFPTIQGVVALGNPLLFALIPVAILWHVARWIRGGLEPSRILLVAALAMWLPWALVDANTYIHYIYPTLPFTLLLVANWLVTLWHGKSALGRGVVVALLAGVVVLFAVFYPLYAALPVSERYWRSLMWLSSWV